MVCCSVFMRFFLLLSLILFGYEELMLMAVACRLSTECVLLLLLVLLFVLIILCVSFCNKSAVFISLLCVFVYFRFSPSSYEELMLVALACRFSDKPPAFDFLLCFRVLFLSVSLRSRRPRLRRADVGRCCASTVHCDCVGVICSSFICSSQPFCPRILFSCALFLYISIFFPPRL